MSHRLQSFEIERVGAAMRLADSQLFLDSPVAAELSFVSHAHSDHIARHRQTIATPATLRLMELRLGGPRPALPTPYGRSFVLGSFTLELLPAGHVLGSAQLRASRGDKRVVYTGDFNPVPGLTAEPAEIARCDVLIIESTFGLPRYALPPREAAYDQAREFARATIAEDAVPVFFAYSLGKAQEGMKALADAGFPLVAHPSISEVCAVYAEFGRAIPHRVFDGAVAPGEVLFLPPNQAEAANALPRKRTAMLSGWALEHGAKYRMGTDEAIALSDHADFQGLVGYVEATGAKRVLTVHGFAAELATQLRDRGFDAQPLDPPRQLELF